MISNLFAFIVHKDIAISRKLYDTKLIKTINDVLYL